MKVAVFLDYANINAASHNLDCEIDYGALLNYMADESEQRYLKVAYAYVPIDPRQEHVMDEKIDNLWRNGYLVKSKVGSIAGDSYKCDFDVEIALDISRVVYESSPDIVVLVSGDSDFIPIVLELRGKGIRVEVAAFSNSMSRDLERKCSGYINLDYLINNADEMQQEIEENPPFISEDDDSETIEGDENNGDGNS